VQDIFGLPTAIYTNPPSTGWQEPISLPAPCPAQAVYEVPYWQIVKDVVGEWPSLLNDIDPTEGIVASLGARPSADAIDYHAMRWTGSAWEDAGRGTFAPTAVLAAAMPQGAPDISIGLGSPIDIDMVAVGDFAIVDDEWLMVTAISGSTMTFARGVLDTVPAAHASGTRVYFVEPHYVNHEYVTGETAQIRLLPKTGRGELGISSASTLSRSIQQRFIRPYPPGNIKLNGSAYPAVVAGDITITWANRNRVTQTANVVKQTDGTITPESGQTTTIRIYGGASLTTLRKTFSGLTGTSQSWTLAQIIADGAGSDGRIRIEVESTRTDSNGTFTSLYKHVIETDRAGYGLQYGNYYGGV
jgi:hypothetical protein